MSSTKKTNSALLCGPTWPRFIFISYSEVFEFTMCLCHGNRKKNGLVRHCLAIQRFYHRIPVYPFSEASITGHCCHGRVTVHVNRGTSHVSSRDFLQFPTDEAGVVTATIGVSLLVRQSPQKLCNVLSGLNESCFTRNLFSQSWISTPPER